MVIARRAAGVFGPEIAAGIYARSKSLERCEPAGSRHRACHDVRPDLWITFRIDAITLFPDRLLWRPGWR